MKKITIENKEYRIAAFDEKITKDFLGFANVMLPDPLTQAKDSIGGFPLHLQELIVKDALAAKRIPRSIDDPQVQAFAKTPEGLGKLLCLLYQKHQPELTEDEVWELHFKATDTLGEKYLEE